MLKKINRLAKRKEFAYLYANGKAFHTNYLTLVFTCTKNRVLKIGFSVSKKVGKAHQRNLVKRRLRAIVSEFVLDLPDNHNVVFIAKAGCENADFETLKTLVVTLLKKSGLLSHGA